MLFQPRLCSELKCPLRGSGATHPGVSVPHWPQAGFTFEKHRKSNRAAEMLNRREAEGITAALDELMGQDSTQHPTYTTLPSTILSISKRKEHKNSFHHCRPKLLVRRKKKPSSSLLILKHPSITTGFTMLLLSKLYNN